MTLWQILVLATATWISGLLCGFGVNDLIRGVGLFGAKKVAAPAARPASEAPPILPDAVESQAPPAPVADLQPAPMPAAERPTRRPFFWMEEPESQAPTIPATDVPPAKPLTWKIPTSKTAAPQAAFADETTVLSAAPQASIALAEPREPGEATTELNLETDGLANEAQAGDLPRVRSIAEGAQTVASVKVSQYSAGTQSAKPRRKSGGYSDPNESAWRALDRRAKSEGIAFWLEIGLLLLLLAGASWGVVYFASQPVASSLR